MACTRCGVDLNSYSPQVRVGEDDHLVWVEADGVQMTSRSDAARNEYVVTIETQGRVMHCSELYALPIPGLAVRSVTPASPYDVDLEPYA